MPQPAGTGAPTPVHTERPAGPRPATVVLNQAVFDIVLVILAVIAFDRAPGADGLRVAGALVLTALATVGAVAAVRQARLPRWVMAVPLVDIAAVAVLSHGGIPVGAAVILPVAWMALMGLLPAVLGVLAALAALSPRLTQPAGLGDHTLALALVLVAVGACLAMAGRRSEAHADLLDRHGTVVEATLADSRQQHQVLNGILNTIDVGIVALDHEGRATIVNRAYTEIMGGDLRVGDEVATHRAAHGYAADGRTPLGHEHSPLVRACRGDRIVREVTWWDVPGGERLALRVSASPLLDDAGQWAGAVVVYQDVSAEMAAIAEREDFVSSVSHELRSPLTSIIGYLDLVTEDPALPPAVREQLVVVDRNAQRLLRLITDLLAAGETRHGAVQLSRTTVDLAELVAEAVQVHAPYAAEHQVTVRNDVRLPCRVHVDRFRMLQVVDNVLSNAVKYSRPGTDVEISLETDHRAVRLWVRDHGVGIAPEDQDKLFTRFHRAAAVRSGPIPGTGLGLHISRQIMEAHGGTIELRSVAAEGTEVAIVLPASVLQDSR